MYVCTHYVCNTVLRDLTLFNSIRCCIMYTPQNKETGVPSPYEIPQYANQTWPKVSESAEDCVEWHYKIIMYSDAGYVPM